MSNVLNLIFLNLYRMFVVPLGLVTALLLSPFIPKLRATLNLRKVKPAWPPWIGQQPTLWVHCASGEFEYAKAVLREWRTLKPDHKIFVSYYSPSYQRAIQASSEVDFSSPLPLDLARPMRQFIKRLNPQLLAVSRTDLWPEMCAQARSLGVPITLFSATQKPLRWWQGLAKPIMRWRLELCDQILAVSEQDQNEIKKIGVRTPPIKMGDSRYDQVIFRLQHPKQLSVIPKLSVPTLVAGSTWKEDEDVLLPAMADLLLQRKIRLVLVPHEPTPSHLQELQNNLSQLKIEFQTYSQISQWTAPVLLVDQIGILAELYTWGDMALVGGSFKGSVHSVMEPLACGLPTLLGPYHLNNREAVEFQSNHLTPNLSMVSVAKNAEQLKHQIEALLQSDLPELKEKIQASIRVKLGAARKIAETLLSSSKR